jgi:hypothetical protein
MRLSFLTYLLTHLLTTTFGQNIADARLEDFIYNETIKTALLYPGADNAENPSRLIGPPVIPLSSNRQLVLEFDDLKADYDNFRVKLIHCNADWTKSVLNDIEFTYEFNDYRITKFSQSFSTKIPYFHYYFEVPKVKLSGNYVLVVFSDNTRKPILSRRFMVYDNKVSITAQARFSQGIQQSRSEQQVDFSLDYKSLPLISPQSDLTVVLRQNFRWDNAKTNFKPTNIRPFDKIIDYQFFNLENSFKGGNEFRYFDSRTLSGRGYGVYELERLSEFTRVILNRDKPRDEGAYIQTDDLNGQYIIDHKDSGNGSIEADYTPVVFTLKIMEIENADVYVNGGFNFWNKDDNNRMTYNQDLQTYNAVILLKQGVINYNYLVDKSGKTDESYIEGDYSTTENDYDILVYYRPPAGRADQLAGYRTVEWNRRR